jgi:dihydrofolate reductase
MRQLSYTFAVSLDGFINGPDGTFDWAVPDTEEHDFHNDLTRETGTFLYGRRMYELMNRYWPTADREPGAPREVVEFARLWQAVPKVVFSTTLDRVEGNARLVRANVLDEVRRLKAEDGKELSVSGAGLAASLMPHGLIDEYRLLVHPVVAGGGTPFFSGLAEPIDLRLVETRTFGSGVICLRYRQTSISSPPTL